MRLIILVLLLTQSSFSQTLFLSPTASSPFWTFKSGAKSFDSFDLYTGVQSGASTLGSIAAGAGPVIGMSVPFTASGTPVIVQSISLAGPFSGPVPSGNSFSLTLANPTTLGDTLICVVFYRTAIPHGGSTFDYIWSDNLNGTWAGNTGGGTLLNGTGPKIGGFIDLTYDFINVLVAGVTTVTYQLTTAVDFQDYCIGLIEVSGLGISPSAATAVVAANTAPFTSPISINNGNGTNGNFMLGIALGSPSGQQVSHLLGFN